MVVTLICPGMVNKVLKGWIYEVLLLGAVAEALIRVGPRGLRGHGPSPALGREKRIFALESVGTHEPLSSELPGYYTLASCSIRSSDLETLGREG